MNVIEWIKKGVANGAGEILLTSVDQEGTGKGFDIDSLYYNESAFELVA